MSEQKINVMKKIEYYEKIILELENLKLGEQISSQASKQFGKIENSEQKEQIIKLLKENIKLTKESIPPDIDKLYLSEIMKEEKVVFESNNLILAPVGSGKTTLIKDLIQKDGSTVLMLVSNTALKNSLAPSDEEMKMVQGENTFTTKNKKSYGDNNYKIHVMSYTEFGNRIRLHNHFADEFKQIFCDEIHSLPDYQSYTDSSSLSIALKYLLEKHNDKIIYYFTATKENLDKLKQKDKQAFANVKVFNYLNHPKIRRYIALSSYKINNIDQIRPHLNARIKSFKYFGYKCLAFNKTIAGQKRIAEIAENSGFVPLVLWSINNESEKMTDEQLKAREHLLTTGEIPEPYNFLIINSAMQEGWNLVDKKVKLAIMNTINETEKIQALGRLRNDIDILIYKTQSSETPDLYANLDSRYLNKELTSEDKDELCISLGLVREDGRLMKWPSIKTLLINQGYNVVDKKGSVDVGRKRVSIITI